MALTPEEEEAIRQEFESSRKQGHAGSQKQGPEHFQTNDYSNIGHVLGVISGKGGVFSHLGTTDMIEAEKMMNNGDEHAKLVINAMIYHIAKAIAEKGAVLCGKIDAIIITGGIAYWKYMVDELQKRISWMAPVHIYPGEDEMSALAANAAAVLNGEIEVKKY